MIFQDSPTPFIHFQSYLHWVTEAGVKLKLIILNVDLRKKVFPVSQFHVLDQSVVVPILLSLSKNFLYPNTSFLFFLANRLRILLLRMKIARRSSSSSLSKSIIGNELGITYKLFSFRCKQ